MFDVVLFQPEIPPNTGNIIRLCANTGTRLHLIHPLGFNTDEPSLRRAGLDYREWAEVREHDDLEAFFGEANAQRLIAVSTRGARRYDALAYARGDALVFGPEGRGLPAEVLARAGSACTVRIPMATTERSLNLSNAAAVVVYEALRQHGFPRLT